MDHLNIFQVPDYKNQFDFSKIDKKKTNNFPIYYSKKCVISRRLQFDQDTCTVSASKLGVITCTMEPARLSQPVFSVS